MILAWFFVGLAAFILGLTWCLLKWAEEEIRKDIEGENND